MEGVRNRFKKLIPASEKWKWLVRKNIKKIRSLGKKKFFGIGYNKTGTTSLEAAMDELGYVVSYQIMSIEIMREWGQRDFKRLIKYCKCGQFFQDIPFSKPYTFIVLDQYFPGSKFILTVRDSPEQWYDSLTSFHAKLWGKNGRVPNKEDLILNDKIYKNYRWENNRLSSNTPEYDIYNKDILIEGYERHIRNVEEYFRHRPDDLLVINVSEEDAYQKLCSFLGVDAVRERFPWKNKTEEVQNR